MVSKFKLLAISALMLALLAGCAAPAQPSPTAAPIAAGPTNPAASATAVMPQETATQPAAAEPSATLPAPSPTPAVAACSSPAAITPALTEGPYFTPNSPEKTSLLEAGMSGTHLVLSGYVWTQDCTPVANAMLDFWQADAQGQYDNSGYTLRGHLFTDANGFYQVETVVPGLYPGRTEHIHVKVQAPNGPVLTTQLFMPGVTQNDADGIFDPAMVMTISDTGDGLLASFNFVINAN